MKKYADRMENTASSKLFLKKHTAGYTLIELMVAISIIGLLSSVILNSLDDARNQARYTVAEQELVAIADAIYLAGNIKTPMTTLTATNCSGCQCRMENNSALSNLHNYPESPYLNDNNEDCMEIWTTALSNFADASPLLGDDYVKFARDPWGAPYLLDENEGERTDDPTTTADEYCNWDHIRTAGADGINKTSDDYVIQIPYRTDRCKAQIDERPQYNPYRF